MGLVNGALQIGRSALLAYQSALQVVGQNVSNAGTDTYARQTPLLSSSTGVVLPEGFMPGGGVMLSTLQRNVDASLDGRLRVALGDQADALVQQQALGRIESVLNELSDSDLSSLMQQFFNSFSTLQNTPHDLGARGMVITAGQTLVSEIQRQRVEVLALRDELNADMVSSVQRADQLAAQIADLNRQITSIESPGTGAAAALRDKRDVLLRDLGQIVQIQVREQPDNGVNVYIGNELFISGGINRGLTTTLETVDQEPRVVVRFADNNREVSLTGGELAGLATARDVHVLGHVDALNGLAQALINEVNKVHAGGQGLNGFESVTGAIDVLRSDAALNSANAGLQLTPRNGSFVLYLTNTQVSPASRVATTITVNLSGVGAAETLDSLAAKINAVDNITAEVTADNRLKLTAADGCEISFGEDSSYVLAALGINTFFTGTNAQDLSVNPLLVNNQNLLAAATQHTEGDGSNAGALSALATTSLAGLRGQSLSSYYAAIASDVAVRSAAASAGVQSADAITSALTSQREAISGVSLDEETISMLRFERAFTAAARYTTVVDGLLKELLALVA